MSVSGESLWNLFWEILFWEDIRGIYGEILGEWVLRGGGIEVCFVYRIICDVLAYTVFEFSE